LSEHTFQIAYRFSNVSNVALYWRLTQAAQAPLAQARRDAQRRCSAAQPLAVAPQVGEWSSESVAMADSLVSAALPAKVED
jgi:hypothetical protein